MNALKKILAALMLLCLFVNMIPAAFAADMDVRLSANTDYSELKKQVAIANGLKSYEYTAETWAPLKTALDKGNLILKGTHGQVVVDTTAVAIEKAMAALVRMDYSRLEAVFGEAYAVLEDNVQLYDVWYRLTTALENARPLLSSGNQAAVNYAAEELDALLEEMASCGEYQQEPQVVIQEVEVEVLPTDDYCNIPMHRTWPVLFVISAVLNVALIVVLTYVIMKKRNTVDNTPLVSYDIDDDMDY